MTVTVDIEFPAEDGTLLRGWFFAPDGAEASPTIVMSHGFGGVAAQIRYIAEEFVKGGFAVLLYDHRTCGRSDGEPRQDLDPIVQVRDLVRAISFATGRDEVDSERIGLWGTSYSGGHVIAAGGMDHKVRAIVAQIPFIAGYETFQGMAGTGGLRGVEAMVAADRASTLAGSAPGTVKITRRTSDPADEFALFPDDNAYEYLITGPYGSPENWTNSITTRSVGYALNYDVRQFLKRITPTPLMMLVAYNDPTTPTDIALQAFEDALEPKELVLLNGDHYDPYLAGHMLETAVAAALRWFDTHLKG